jgi:hypothetical protein
MRVLTVLLALAAACSGPPRLAVQIDAGAAVDAASDGAAPAPLRVLFVGNSYTRFNDLPQVVAALGAELGVPMQIDTFLRDGASFWEHWNETGAVARLEAGGYDVAVLQGQSLEPMGTGIFAFDQAAEGLGDLVDAQGARAVWFATWPRRAGHEYYQTEFGIHTPAEMNDVLERAYRDAAHRCDEGFTARVGAAFLLASAELPEVELYANDGSHPSPAGSLLAACVVTQGITGLAPRVPEPSPLGLDGGTARALCALAPRVACVQALTLCDGACVDVDYDEDHCSACGVACAAEEPCLAGVCGCTGTTTACNEDCFDTRYDARHCGGCGIRCSHHERCDLGTCVCLERRHVDVRPALLAELEPACDDTTDLGSLACATAGHRLCEATACFGSGFGPIQVPGDAPGVMCVAEQASTTTFTELTTWDATCTGPGTDCMTAIHRLCVARGAAAGFGPVAIAGDEVSITCLDDATVVTTDVAALRLPFPDCDPAAAGPVCATNSWFMCQTLNHLGGYGPVEVDGATASIVCVE